ncbi:S8 family serine peptidase [Flavobacterium sp. CYK-55]|uniref:S8 family serine peptidase n=1 Tax=Flavobacterium sp. CYK-55 TaxID=2835529 RepID=UPI001BCB3E3F|nr:S8 family serine peptidase [Flavobacterium sp. CYK-55]MBS7787959.1 S8 family serine peptidase [Flavobacterium sp. CYK-55]
MKKLFTPIVMLGVCLSVFSQNTEDIKKIQAASNMAQLTLLARQKDSLAKAQKTEAWKLAQTKGWPTTVKGKNGSFKELIRIDQDGNPVYFSTDNAGAAMTTRANRLNTGGSLGLNLDGQGMTIGVWDGGKVRDTHVLLNGRTTQFDNATELSLHATHVSGTMIGGNGSANAKGMASQAQLKAYDWNSDESEVITAAANGLLISNHSYGADPDSVPISMWGRYNGEAQSFDEIMFNAPYYQFVNSAGNSRNSGYNPDKEGYDLLSGKSNSKNGIIVAAVNQVTNYTSASSVTMSGFSSWGPSDDGRIKPDICGKGVNVRSSTSNSDTSYQQLSGTSMSSPNVAGTLLLLQQHYKNVKGFFMRAATLRGLALHTADEAGSDPGPDYRFGWGLLNAEKAAVLISKEGAESYIQENDLAQNKTYSFDVKPFNTAQPIMASICWTDPAGATVFGAVDNPTPALVNDLDLRLTQGNQESFPWKLNPAIVDDPAIKGDNTVDNIEKIELSNPNGTYTVTVSHKGNLTNAHQNYSLIISNVIHNPMFLSTSEPVLKRYCQGTNEAQFNYHLKIPATFSGIAQMSMTGLPAGASTTFSSDTMNTSGEGSVVISGLNSAAVGTYVLMLKADSGNYHGELTLTLVIQNELIAGPTLTSPANNTNPASISPTLIWQNVGSNAASYTIELSKTADFTSGVTVYSSNTNQIDLDGLDAGSNYYWRVKSNNVCGTSEYSTVYQFTTACSNDTQITVSNITAHTAEITWSNPNGSSSFEIAVVPSGQSPVGAYQTVSTNSFIANNLTSFASYDVYIRAQCSNNVFSAITSTGFNTKIDYCFDNVFYDTGGPSGNYSNQENDMVTIYPLNAGEKVSVTFTSFELEDQLDRLTIYNGPNNTYPYIVEQYGFTGNNNPGTITSTDASGALTFLFYSDGVNTYPGWSASVNCSVLGQSKFDRLPFLYYPNPAQNQVNIKSKNVIDDILMYNMLGQLIQKISPKTNETSVDISELSNGQYLMKVATGQSYNTVKITKQN